MKKPIILSFFFFAINFVHAQECVTQLMDTRSPELIEEIERNLTQSQYHGQRSVTYLQTVVHVIWNNPNDNLSDSVVQANIDLVNKDLRRQNADTSETPDYFLPVAADTEIELRLAQVDPNGQSTNGITHTYTDSTQLLYEFGHMKYDSTGGKTAWDPEHYLNIWIVRNIDVEITGGGILLGTGTLPESLPEEERGLVIRAIQFTTENGWRTITHELGHYTCLLHPTSYGICDDADLVADTPIGQDSIVYSCTDTLITCGNGPYGNMHMNFMSYGNADCMNIFTHGQKARMLSCIDTHLPGLREYYYLGVDDVESVPLKLTPNPTTNLLNFQSPDYGRYSIFDVQGRILQSGVVQPGKSNLELSQLPSGIYLLRLKSDKGISTARFVKN